MVSQQGGLSSAIPSSVVLLHIRQPQHPREVDCFFLCPNLVNATKHIAILFVCFCWAVACDCIDHRRRPLNMYCISNGRLRACRSSRNECGQCGSLLRRRLHGLRNKTVSQNSPACFWLIGLLETMLVRMSLSPSPSLSQSLIVCLCLPLYISVSLSMCACFSVFPSFSLLWQNTLAHF